MTTEDLAMNPFLKKLESVNITKAYFNGVSNIQQYAFSFYMVKGISRKSVMRSVSFLPSQLHRQIASVEWVALQLRIWEVLDSIFA